MTYYLPYCILACGLTDAAYDKQYWLNIPALDVESPDIPFVPNPDGITQPMRPPVREFRKRGIHHTLPEQRHVRREEAKTLPNGIVGDEVNDMVAMQELHDTTFERTLIRPHIAAHYNHLLSKGFIKIEFVCNKVVTVCKSHSELIFFI